MTCVGLTNAAARCGTTEQNDNAALQPHTQGTRLPDPFYPNGLPLVDAQTALLLLAVEASRDGRSSADAQRAAGEKAQEAAHARKIDKMRELADDTFATAMVDGAFQGLSAAAQVGSAAESFSSATSELDAKGATCLLKADTLNRAAAVSARTSKLLDASSKAMSAAGTVWSGAEKSAQEYDRADLAVIDHDIDRAKSMVDGASAQSKRADDDIHQTINSLREYVAAKSQAAQAAIFKG
jgi:hypothetical protein